VTLTVTNDRGLSASTSQTLSVGNAALPTATLTFSPAAPGVNEQVFFNGSTSTPGQGHSSITSYRWNFGDGTSGSGQTVSHAFTAAGTYTVQLTVTDESGLSATSAGTTVLIGNPPGPTANFTFSPATPIIGDTVVFDWRTSTTAQGQRIVSLDWNFGDDTPVVHCPGNPACTADGITTHVFLRAGTYNVNLVVMDSAGRTSTKSSSIPVGAGLPTAVLSLNKIVATTVQADGSASTAQGSATITTYTFAWGDGSASATGSNAVVNHTFPVPVPPATSGTFTVRLTVTDSLGRTGTTTATVTVP
jgi:PKD repeat protein